MNEIDFSFFVMFWKTQFNHFATEIPWSLMKLMIFLSCWQLDREKGGFVEGKKYYFMTYFWPFRVVLSVVCRMLSVICVLTPAYSGLCRGLEYSLKIQCIILVDPNIAVILIFKTLCLGRSKTLPYVWKKISQERHLRLVSHIFTKLSQIVCLINVHILICQHAKCDCRLWNVLWFNCVFSGIFI